MTGPHETPAAPQPPGPPPLAVRGSDRALALASPPNPAAEPGAPTVLLADSLSALTPLGALTPAGQPPLGALTPAGQPAEGPATPAPHDVVWLPGSGEAVTQLLRALTPLPLVVVGPWPAGDALFEMPPAPAPLGLVAGGDEERRAHVVEKLAARGLPARAAPVLTAEELAAASLVALLGDADAATPEAPWAATAMPAEAPAVLAARRVLIAPRCATTFGLLPGTDHLAFGTGDDVVQYADAVLTFPESFAPLATFGARTAERHRASRVYARLADELRSAPRSAAPRD